RPAPSAVGRDVNSARIHKEFAMSATLENRFSLTDDPAEIIRRLRESGELNESLLDDAEPPAAPAAPSGRKAGGKRSAGRSSPRLEAPAMPLPAGAPTAGPAVTLDGRDAKGRFVKGNRGGPGNPYNRQVAEFRSHFLAASTPEIFQKAVEALIKKVIGGDIAALKLYFQYTMGKPADAVNPDRVDFDECDLLQRTHATSALPWAQLMQAPCLETILELARLLRPALDARCRTDVAAGVAARDAEAARLKEQAEQKRARREAKRAAKAKAEAPTPNGGNGTVADASSGSDGGSAAGSVAHETADTTIARASRPSSNGGNGGAG